jgi:predicted esterase
MAEAGGKRVRPRSPLLLCILVLAAACAFSAPADAAVRFKSQGADTLGGADALAGSPAACEATVHRVWVKVDDHAACIAYHPTRNLVGAGEAVVFFEGDIPSGFRRDGARLASYLRKLMSFLDSLAERHRVAYIVVARPGTFGSTGSHDERRKSHHVHTVSAAVDAIVARHGLRRIALAGQSGGATMAAALVTLGRKDVACAALGSGGYDLAAMLDWHSERLGLEATHREHPARLADRFNVMDRIGGIAEDKTRRILVIADRQDRVTPFAQQRRFAEAVQAAGHDVQLLEAEGRGAERHGLAHAALPAAAVCLKGGTTTEIRRAVGRP